jgi:hypothetical protein
MNMAKRSVSVFPKLKKYSGKWSLNILADYCWSLISETPAGEYKRQS